MTKTERGTPCGPTKSATSTKSELDTAAAWMSLSRSRMPV